MKKHWVTFQKPQKRLIIMGLLTVLDGLIMFITIGSVLTGFSLNFISWCLHREWEKNHENILNQLP